MEEFPYDHLIDSAGKIIRSSIFIFLKYFHFFSTIPVLLFLPLSASILLSQSLIFHNHSPFLTTWSFSSLSLIQSPISLPAVFVLSLPFVLSSFVISKASVIQALTHHYKPSPTPSVIGYLPFSNTLILTQVRSLILIITISAATFCLLSFLSGFLESFQPPYPTPVLMIITDVVSFFCLTIWVLSTNLALVVAGVEHCSAYAAIQKACLIRKSNNSATLLLFLPTNMGLAAVEALFRYRIIRAYHLCGGIVSAAMALEGLLIAYLFGVLIVLDTIVCYNFYKSCESDVLASGKACGSCQEIGFLEQIP